MDNQDVWEVKCNNGSYGKYVGLDAEKKARANFEMRLDSRPKNSHMFELYRNGAKLHLESSKIKSSGVAQIAKK